MTTGDKLTILDKHNAAMAECDKARLLELQMMVHNREAARLEAEALAMTKPEAQPTYSILARSLVALLLTANQPKEAIKAIETHRPHCQEWVQEEMDQMLADAKIDQERRVRRYGPDEDDDTDEV